MFMFDNNNSKNDKGDGQTLPKKSAVDSYTKMSLSAIQSQLVELQERIPSLVIKGVVVKKNKSGLDKAKFSGANTPYGEDWDEAFNTKQITVRVPHFQWGQLMITPRTSVWGSAEERLW